MSEVHAASDYDTMAKASCVRPGESVCTHCLRTSVEVPLWVKYAVALGYVNQPHDPLRRVPGVLLPHSCHLPAPEVNRAPLSKAKVNVRQQVGDQGENGGRTLLIPLGDVSCVCTPPVLELQPPFQKSSGSPPFSDNSPSTIGTRVQHDITRCASGTHRIHEYPSQTTVQTSVFCQLFHVLTDT